MRPVREVGVSEFVKRHRADGYPQGFHGSWEELLALIEAQWAYRQVSPHHSGVMLVGMPQEVLSRFYTRTVALTPETPLKALFAPRAAGEAPFAQVLVKGESEDESSHQAQLPKTQQAQKVEIILYSHEALAADNDAPPTREANYYIVAINAYPGLKPEPMQPMTMARNLLGLKGGTRPEVPYTAEAFAEAIVYWGQHARLE